MDTTDEVVVKKSMLYLLCNFGLIREVRVRPKDQETQSGENSFFSGFSWPAKQSEQHIMGQIFKASLMYQTLLHLNCCYCCARAVFALLKVRSRQTTQCTNNVFDRAISHRSDLGSFYQVMNTLKRLHCFPDQYHCF